MAPHTGIDMIEIARIEKVIARWGEAFLHRIYTDAELSLCRKSPSSLAARFACKEAVMKLLGAGNDGISWRDIETLAQPGGKPLVNLYGRAKSEASKLGISEIAVSLSHSREYAIASVVSISETNHS